MCFLRLVDVFFQPSIILAIAHSFLLVFLVVMDLVIWFVIFHFSIYGIVKRTAIIWQKDHVLGLKNGLKDKCFFFQEKKKMSSFCVYISEKNYSTGDNNPAEPVFKKQWPTSSIPSKVMLLIFFPRSYFVK